MNELPEEPLGTNQLLDEATLWFARMRGPEAARHKAAFESWLARGALHRAAYNRAAEIFSFGKFLADEARAAPKEPASAQLRRPRTAIVAIALCCAVLLSLWSYSQPGGNQDSRPAPLAAAPAEVIIQAPPAEGRVERLADGSTVTLGPDARLSVRFDAGRRLLVLTRGRARFEVAKEARAFIVSALGTRITAHGTVFDVMIADGLKVKVRLLEGRIDVVSPARLGLPEKRTVLTSGQAIEVQGETMSTGIIPTSGPASPRVQAAGEDLREYDGERLDKVLADANRVAKVRIALADPGIGELRVSGRFRLSDTHQLADRLAAVFDLKVVRSTPDHIVLTRRRQIEEFFKA